MNLEEYLENFAAIADAKGGLEGLREILLTLAVNGQLVDQRPGESPVEDALTELLVAKGPTLAGSIRSGDSVPRRPSPDEQDAPLPSGWSWARLDDTGQYVNGLAFRSQDWKPKGTPIVRIQNLTNTALPFNYADGPFPEDRVVRSGEILVSWSGTLDAFLWDRGEAVVNQHIFRVIPEHSVVTTQFLYYLLLHSIRKLAASEAAHGLAMKHINRGPFLSLPVRLPPLDEQVRIVQTLQVLLSQCAELSAKFSLRESIATSFRQSALDALARAATPIEATRTWQRVSASMSTLTGSSAAIADVRAMILHLAVTGRLPGLADLDPEEDAFHARLPELAAESADGLILDRGWKKVRLGDLLADGLSNGSSPIPAPEETGIKSLKLSATTSGWFDRSQAKYVDMLPKDAERYWLQPGDLLIQRSNTPAFVGTAALYDGPPNEFVYPDLMMRGRLVPEVSAQYVHLCLLSRGARDYMAARASGTSQSMVKLNQKSVLDCPINLPCRSEQERIVTTVYDLLGKCNVLAAQLQNLEDSAVALSASVTSSITTNPYAMLEGAR